MQPQSGGKFRPRLNMGERPIANKYREGSRWGPTNHPGRMRSRAILRCCLNGGLQHAPRACLALACSGAPACGLPIRPVLNTD
ncbi:unnamed protein product [Brassica napus]|uniref:(rape) hypothetical protein n=1 Tax=Brassica napus TaxID=3708 RepID=A0A816P3K6_BRANA|nr:unnamed protein product [Brassica napus]